jgi:hypothetical protein
MTTTTAYPIPATPSPVNPEDYDGFQDSDGCPDPDNDSDLLSRPDFRVLHGL